jgi:hypothetical protein
MNDKKDIIFIEDIKIIVKDKEYTFWSFADLKEFVYKLKTRRK